MTPRNKIRAFLRNDMLSMLRSQLVSLRSVMLLIYTPVVIIFGIVILIRLSTGIAIAEFTRDPLGFTDIPVYTGSISNLGVMLWSGAVAVCFFCSGVIRARGANWSFAQFMLVSGCLTLVLLLDDLFMLHEVVYPQYLGLLENLIYTVYVVVLVWFVMKFHAIILQTGFLLLLLALAGFAASVSVDHIASVVPVPGLYVFEDGAKLFGIVSWTAYFVLVGARYIVSDRPPSAYRDHPAHAGGERTDQRNDDHTQDFSASQPW